MRILLSAPLILAAGVALGAVCLVGLGFALDSPEAALERSEAIVVISGDEDLSRFREGLRLYRQGWGSVLVFSGAARDEPVSNAQVMRDIALREGVPERAILVDHEAVDTLGNARNTLRLLQERGLRSAILVTSPYHLRRAEVTFQAIYSGSGIRLLAHAAPDDEWRKLTWWLYPHTRRLTLLELEKLAYILVTGRHQLPA
ncbi:MAG: YdcF family protein [Chloroflexi bacterium]|nr:YdcF family protein [Chloroflexota bacterium]